MAGLMIAQPMKFRVDVKTGLVERPQRESLMRGDKKANRIIAELVMGDEPFDLTGVTVKGKFCKPPNGDAVELEGEVQGNLAIVQLDDACYTQDGHYTATVSLVLNDVERTVLLISGDVLRSGSGNAASDEPGGGGGGNTGSGLPAGGTAGQVLVKVSSAQGAAVWKTLTAADVGARPDTWTPTAEEVGARPDTWTPTAEEVGARPDTWTPTAEEVGARPDTWTPTAEEVGARPDTWTPTAEEVGARPDTWTPTAEEVGALPADSIDDTLKEAGKAADAAAVGAELTQLKEKNDAQDEALSALNQAKVNKTGWNANKYLGTDYAGNVVEKDAPTDGGIGTVTSVNGETPDKNGNVKLDAEKVGALPSGGTAADSDKLGGKTLDELQADAKKKYGNLVVFGDSLGYGADNGAYSFVDVLSESGAFESIAKACVSGATIGPYQTESSASGYDLNSQIERYSQQVADADIIMLEYQANDIWAVGAGNVSMGAYTDTASTVSVCGYLRKAIERIYEINPGARIMYLPVNWKNYLRVRAKYGGDTADQYLLFEATVIRLAITLGCSVVSLYNGINLAPFHSQDGTHLTTEGHKKIAEKLLCNMLAETEYAHTSRILTLSGSPTSLTLDASFSNVVQMLSAGVDVRMKYTYGTYPFFLHPSHFSNSFAMFYSGTLQTSGSGYQIVFVRMDSSGYTMATKAM